MSTQVQTKRFTLEEYFEYELKAERRHEFIDGKIEPVTYTSKNHGRIVSNLHGLLFPLLGDRGLEIYAGDRMLHIPPCNRIYYPDLIILPIDTDTFQYKGKMEADLYPTALVEVLSDSTEDDDRTDKWRCYKMIDSLRQYVLISQKYPYIETFHRREKQREWLYTFYDDLEQEVEIAGCPVRLEDVYRRVERGRTEKP